MKLKKFLKISVLVGTGLVALLLLLLIIYYLFLFHDPNPLVSFAPADADLFAAVEKPLESFETLQSFLGPDAREEISRRIGNFDIGRVSFFLGDAAAVCMRGKEIGLACRISLAARLLLALPPSLAGLETEETTIRGNSVLQITFDKQKIFLVNARDIALISFTPDMAGDMAELINRRPIITPLSRDPEFLSLTGPAADGPVLFARNREYLRDSLLGPELKPIKALGGRYSLSPAEFSLSLNLQTTPALLAKPAFPEFDEAFLTAALPMDLNRAWLDYCFSIQSRDRDFTSFQVSLTSEVFDKVVETIEPRVFAYAFSSPRVSIYPSLVLALEGTKVLPEAELKKLLTSFVGKTQTLNTERVKRYKVQKVDFTQAQKTVDGINIHYIALKPTVIANFTPGFCIFENKVLIATDHSDLEKVLPHIRRTDAPPIANSYYLRLTDPGLQTSLSYLKRSLNDPARKRRMGEAAFARRIDRYNQLENFVRNIRAVDIRDTGESHLRGIEVSIQALPPKTKPQP